MREEKTSAATRAAALEKLLQLHAEVDGDAENLARRHGSRLQCRKGCSPCCLDHLTVFAVEAERIRQEQGTLLRTGSAHPVGACAFLDETGACRIYASRPYVCRTQGLPLLAYEETQEGELLEIRDICELNRPGPALASLEEEDFWLLGRVELELSRLQREFSGGDEERVSLRSLWADRGHEKSVRNPPVESV